MTTTDKIARRKLSLLDLASELSNVSRACKVMGYSRQQFYEIRRNFQTYGAEGLIDRLPGARGPHPNRVAAEIETAILDHALEHPCHGSTRVEQELRLKGIAVSSGGVAGCLAAPQPAHQARAPAAAGEGHRRTQDRAEGRPDQAARTLLPRSSANATSKPRYTGALVAVDTFFVGALKGVGKVYLQTAIDCHSRYAWARLYPSQAAGHRRSHPEPRRAPDLRGARRQDRRRSVGQWPRVLRPARPASLRAVPATRRHRTPHHARETAPVQRHRRTLPSHPSRRALPCRRQAHMVRDH